MNTVERRVRAMINPWSTAFARWWCHSAARFTLTGHGPRRRVLRRDRDVVRPTPADTAASRIPQAVRIEPLTHVDVASAVELAVRVLRVKPGDLVSSSQWTSLMARVRCLSPRSMVR